MPVYFVIYQQDEYSQPDSDRCPAIGDAPFMVRTSPQSDILVVNDLCATITSVKFNGSDVNSLGGGDEILANGTEINSI